MKIQDQLGRLIELKNKPKRIISIVPSQTELLYDLGLAEEVVGITKFCIHPEEWHRNKKRVGGTKQLNMDLIAELKPDLIIGNKEENEEGQVKQLMEDYPVWMSDIYNIQDAYEMITLVSKITNKEKEGYKLIGGIKNEFKQLKINNSKFKNSFVGYFIWRKPYMVAGGNTFINYILEEICGLKNVFSDDLRYPEVTVEKIKKAKPDLIFLSSEPYPFKQNHIDEIRQLLPASKVMLVDGELFSWYGSRLLQSPKYFSKILEGSM